MTAPPSRKPMSLRRARSLALEIVAHHFGSRPARLVHKSSGLTNFVFEAVHAQGDFIVRLSNDAGKLNAYLKEQWASDRSRKVGVPTAEILEVGSEVVPYPYMVSLKVRGEEATDHPNRLDIVRAMGALAKRIHGIRTRGYGRTFDWSSNTLSKRDTWRDYLDTEFRVEERIAVLERWKMLPLPTLRNLRAILRRVGRWHVRPGLTHGDLRLKNVIVDQTGRIGALIDWENCESNVTPHWDLAFALHDLGIDAKQAFVEGYGLRAKDLLEMTPTVRAINLLGYAPAVEMMAAAKDRRGLELYRARLGGALDLYAL